MRHTSGPWRKGRNGQEGYIFGPDGVAVVQAVNRRDVDLIAAAPELLSVLEEIAEDTNYPISPEIDRKVVTLLKKAKGE